MTPEQQLIHLYRQAAKRLRVQMQADLRNENFGSLVWRRRRLQAVQAELLALGQRTRTTPIDVVAAAYDRGAGLVDVLSGRATVADVVTGKVSYAFVGTHRRPALVLADNLVNRLDGARVVVGRRVEDVYRQAGLEAVSEGVAAGQTRRETSRLLERRLIRDGVTGFVDRRGAQWQLDTYSEMVARTTTREAMSAGTAARMRETGQQLVHIPSHATSCEICQPYEGLTWALPGETVDGYDTIDQLPPFHPRCLHVAAPASENLEAMLSRLGVAA